MKSMYQDTAAPHLYFRDKIDDEVGFNFQALTKNKVVCIQSKKAFYELKDQWNQLVKKSLNPQPFLLWEWVYTWWEVYNKKNNKLYILAIYEANELIAIAPFYIKYHTPLIACLSMLGEGENKADAIVSHYPDIIVKQPYQDKAISTISDFLQEYFFSQKSFNFASFNLVKGNSLIQELEQKLSSACIFKNEHLENQFIIDLPNDEDEYVAGLSKSTRKQFRMKLSRMKKAGDIEIKTEHDLEKGLDLIEDLHRERWHDRTDHCVFDSKQFSSFHKKLCQRFQQQGILNFRVLYHNKEAIAAMYNFNYGSTSYSYLSGFKSSDDKRLSPMFVFDILEIQNLIREKYQYFDLLASEASNNYKAKYGSEKHPVYKLLWLQKGIGASVFLAYLKVRPSLAKIYRRLKGTIKK